MNVTASPIASAFSATYREARAKFLATASAAGLQATSILHPLQGPEGEELALDLVRDGPPEAERVLILSSACHGVEGFCGSGVQVTLLQDAAWRAECARTGTAVVYAHGLNPWGFAWLRRMTNENVDLNRNFHDFGGPLPENAGYAQLAEHIVPAQWPQAESDREMLEAYARANGPMALQQAITGGQHSHPQGLFFGGNAPTWSQGAMRRMLREQAGRCKTLGWIDFHTGLGPRGHGERILAGPPETGPRARHIWGHMTSPDDGTSTSAPLTGNLWVMVAQEVPQAEYTGMALEYGVVPLQQTLDALRGDQWLHNHPEASQEQRARIKRELLDAFYGDDDAWKTAIVEQGREAAMAYLRA
ncbi:M14 family metallopeptidase [Ramlibacter sp.]|uniref:M14 family metallopeptidase n=1 Tax=Ramlibacter sp. TaxID=1917967 RepID=UPI0017A82EBE|nr:M14 family metallopeptidase [Ramlibacter sp.]MBA2676158.1 DUF2817 domain-containing protein [Ramlibacter sp.]